MKKKRLIPVVLLRNGWLVQSKEFKRHQNIGNPTSSVKRFSEWESDELIYLNISNNDTFDMRRDDLRHPNHSSLLDILTDVSKVTFMPITIGGGIRNLSDIQKRLSLCADKVSINTQALNDPNFIYNDYNPLLDNADTPRSSVTWMDIDYSQNPLVPVNFNNILNNSADRAFVQDSNYNSKSWSNLRYNGSRTNSFRNI